MVVSRVVWVNGNGRVSQHRLRSRRSHMDELVPVDDGVANGPQRPLAVFVFDFVIGERRFGDGIPVDEVLTPVNQPLIKQQFKHVTNGFGTLFIHAEPETLPITASSHGADLFEDGCQALFLPDPNVLEKLLAGKFESVFALCFEEMFFHDRLGGDASMIGSWKPERFESGHRHARGSVLQLHCGLLRQRELFREFGNSFLHSKPEFDLGVNALAEFECYKLERDFSSYRQRLVLDERGFHSNDAREWNSNRKRNERGLLCEPACWNAQFHLLYCWKRELLCKNQHVLC